MANFLDGALTAIADRIYSKMTVFVNGKVDDPNLRYFSGRQPPQLKVKPGQPNDNVILNFIGLAVWRSVARVLKGGVEFKLPKEAEKQQQYINDLWETNKQNILLQRGVLNAAIYGTGFIKIQPDGIVEPYSGEVFPRLIALDPNQVMVVTDPQDIDDVERYEISYSIGQVSYKEITRRVEEDKSVDLNGNEVDISKENWIIEYYESRPETMGKWVLVDSIEFPFNFPNIIHWQNLPKVGSAKGVCDLDDLIGVQDSTNFIASNIQKIIRNQAHKQRWGRGFSKADKIDWGIDQMVVIPSENGEISQLDANADLDASRAFGTDLRQALFDIAREVDITSITDKVGALTNFGLRVLYGDALDKNDAKRQLLGDALAELNRRLLVMDGNEGESSRPGAVVWHDPLPVDRASEMQSDQLAIEMGIVSKQTVAEKWGYKWDDEQGRIEAEKSSTGNIGSEILRNFMQGR